MGCSNYEICFSGYCLAGKKMANINEDGYVEKKKVRVLGVSERDSMCFLVSFVFLYASSFSVKIASANLRFVCSD